MVVAAALVAADSGVSSPGKVADAFENAAAPVPTGKLDKLVFSGLARLKVHPVLCSDAVFVRRIYLDLIGTLPTAKEARDVHSEPGYHAQARSVDRPPAPASRVCGLLGDEMGRRAADQGRVSDQPLAKRGAGVSPLGAGVDRPEQALRPVRPRELLTSSGSNFRVGPVNFFRAIQNRSPEGIAGAVALAFMGSRVSSGRPTA